MREVLEAQGREFEFEYPVGPFIFDLALLDRKVLVEFDGPYHEWPPQQRTDQEKEAEAEKHGFVVVRRTVQAATVISPVTIEGL